MRIDSPKMTNAEVTGSFKGSFSGSFEGDIQADSVQYANVLSKPTLLSGSAQIASDISGSFDSLSGSLASRIATHESNNTVDVTLNTAGGPDYLTISGQEITLGTIDLSADTNFAVSDTTGQTGVDLTLTDDTLSATLAGLDTTDSPTFAALTINGAITVTGNVDGRDVSADGSKLDGIEANATADQSDAEIKTAYENNSDTNAFTDALLSKLNGIEASADVTDTANVTSAGAVMDSEVTSLSGIKSLTVPDSTTISSFGASLVDDADASAARTTLGVDAAGTDNSTDVTLVTTSHNYLSLSGQAITLGQIDISDDTNLAVSDTTGQTGINLTLSGDTVSGVVSGLTTTSDVQFANLTLSGDLTVNGDTVSLNATNLEVEDKTISVNRGGTTAASADGAGLHISGANESITWDNGNSRFNFSDDIHAAGNITLTGTVDGRDVATDGTKLDTIATNANNYSHPTHDGDDISIDTSGASVIDTLVVTTNTLGHVTDASATTRTLTLGDLGYTGATNANYITNNNQLTNGAGYTTNTGTVTSVTVGTGLDISNGTTTPAITLDLTEITLGAGLDSTATGLSLDLSELTDMTADVVGSTDELILLDSGAERRKAINEIKLSQFNNDSGFITSYVNTTYSAGTGLDLSGTTFSIESDLRDGISYIGYDSNDYIQWSNNAWTRTVVNGTERLRVDTSGIDVSGRIVADSDITAYSDASLKKDVKTIENALDKTKELRGVEFTRIADESRSIGVIAQELEKVLPELVSTDDEGIKAVNYGQITGLLIEAVKELSAKVEALENK